MILKLNHLQGKAAAPSAQDVVETLYKLLEEGHIDQRQFARLHIQLDWIQYKQNFREVVSVAQGCGQGRNPNVPAIMDVFVDTRQVAPDCLRTEMLRAMDRAKPEGARHEPDRLPLEDFRSFRHSVAWQFNNLYWARLKDWEQATGKGYEQALPGGQSDGHQELAVADSVADFWTLLRDMEAKNRLPAEIFVVEIGVGTGTRCGMWLDRFRQLDEQRATNYYPRVRFLLGDYSPSTLEMSRPAVKDHLGLCSFVVLDALNPLKTLSFLRHKVLHVHLTNVYDNLPDEEVLRRDGRFYFVQSRVYVPIAEARRLAAAYDIPPEKIRSTVEKLLGGNAEYLGDAARGLSFWMEIWKAVRLEERLVALEDLPDSPFPEGLDAVKLEDILRDAPSDFRFHLSSGALESFSNTLPLLYPRGYLQAEDIFVQDFNDYRLGFHGPGKLDGSVVNWVNGALLREVAERAGYDVHFAPFNYRKGSHTSILYTTQRE